MATLSVSGSPSTVNNTLTINFTTDVADITNVQLSRDGGTTYINPMSFTNTSAVFNVATWSNGSYDNCVLKVIYPDDGSDSDTFTITLNLTNCTINNNATTINKGDSYTATVSPNTGYSINDIKVNMGAVNISNIAVTSNDIYINNVTGDIIISAVAIATIISCTAISLNYSSLSFTTDTSAITITASVEPTNTTDTIVWSSSNDSVATVNNGVVTPVADGLCTIYATCGSQQASCSVKVNTAGENASNETTWTSGIPYEINWTPGKYVEPNDGSLQPDENGSYTPMLYCKGASTIVIEAPYYDTTLAFYNEGGTCLESGIGFPGTINIPSNATYFRMAILTTKTNQVTITPY